MYTPTPRKSEESPCQTARSGFYRSDDTARVSGQRIAARPDRVGSERVGRSSFGPTCERASVARRWDELRDDFEGPVAGRRYDPRVARPVRCGRHRGLARFEAGGSACQLSGEQQEKLKAWVAAALPRTTRQIGAWIEKEFGIVYEGRSGLIALLHRLGLEYHKPNVIPRKLDEEKQKAFIESYDNLLNSLADNEAVLFADAVHPTHAARPAGCWAPSQEKLAIEQTSGRQRINIHGAIDLETGQTRMIEALTIDAASTISLLQSIEAFYPMLALIHVFLDNARYHHAKLVQEWLGSAGTTHQAALHPDLLPALEPDRTVMGRDAQNMSRTTSATQLAPNSPMRRSVSCVKQSPRIGRTSVIRSPTISASSTPRIFGL